jgi:cholesterol oxidase
VSTQAAAEHYDWIIVGSGFGGSVSALRLAEKGYRVAVLEKGRRFAASDFPESNWDLRRWMWMPALGLRGFFQMSFFQHVTVMHGVGVGGGSLVYANTLPMPKADFFRAASWAKLADWEQELAPHYATAKRMLGATTNPHMTRGDEVVKAIAHDMGRDEHFHLTDVGVFFGTPGKVVPDPYFGGRGPDRVGCTQCGACMTGCRVGAKNTLDRNYLYLAERLGVRVEPETEVTRLGARPEGGYRLETRGSLERGQRRVFTADRVVLSGGVMGTVPLLLEMRADPEGLPNLSSCVGKFIRTNNEAIIGILSPDRDEDLSKGIAITSILHTDEHSHLEPVRYSSGSGFFRLLVLLHAPGPTVAGRLASAARSLGRHPIRWLKALSVSDFAKQSQMLLYMRTLEGTLSLELGKNAWTGFREGPVTKLDDPSQAPKAFMKEATDLARRFAEKVGGVAVSLMTETLLGVPSTAHILGGACMGESPSEGVIDAQHRVFGYEGLYVIDGSAVSANPGVNPSLTITAMAERAMSSIPAKERAGGAAP